MTCDFTSFSTVFQSYQDEGELSVRSLSTPMGVDYVVIGFDMEVQPLVPHNAA